jgi:hypothetical protein
MLQTVTPYRYRSTVAAFESSTEAEETTGRPRIRQVKQVQGQATARATTKAKYKSFAPLNMTDKRTDNV